jgi:peptidoglycan-N-acetylglucosamine deacetylase
VLGEAFAGSLGGAAALMTYAVRAPSSSVFAPSVSRGATDRKSIALTFDDGPSESTEAVLEILARYQAPATFFVCGANIARLPSVATAAWLAGHEIGNHSHTHPYLCFQGRQRIECEFAAAQQAIEDALGTKPRLMRPPYGIRWFGFREMQLHLSLLGVMWSAIGLDWKLPSNAIAARLIAAASNGAILCLHDGRQLTPKPDISETLKALEATIPALLDRGFRFETVSQLLCPTN